MEIEYEASFININKDEIRSGLKKARAKMIYPEFLMKRYVWDLPKGHEIYGAWIRVRQEFDKITMSVKIVPNDKHIENQKETCITVDSFEAAKEIIDTIGCQKQAYQESKRELWILDGVEITIDEWPFLEPFVEVEGPSEKIVKEVSEKIGFDYSKAIFGSVDFQYAKKYNTTIEEINKNTPNYFLI